MIAEQPAKWIPELEKYFGAGSARRDGNGVVVDTGTQPIRYLTRQDYAARYPGIVPVRPGDHPALLGVRVASLPACEAATACARLIEAHERKVVIGQALFDGEGRCTAVQKVIMVSLDEQTHRSTPFDAAVRAALERYASSKDGLTA